MFAGSRINDINTTTESNAYPESSEPQDPRGWLRLETSPRHQQNGADCHKENARPVRSEPQESHAAPWRLQSVANRAGGFRATKRSPPNSTACQVQESAENEQRAESHQEHSRLSIHRCPAQHNGDSTLQVRKRSGLTSAAVVRS